MDRQGDMVITKPFPNMPIGCVPFSPPSLPLSPFSPFLLCFPTFLMAPTHNLAT